MANNDKENKIKKFTKEAIGKTLNEFNKEIGMADLVEINKNQDRILNGILSQVNDENTEKTEKSNIITLDNSTDGIVELKEIQGDTNVNVNKIEEMPITHDIGDKEGNVFTLNEIPKGAISIGEIQGNTMVNCNKDNEKELVLMTDLSTQGDNNITLTEGVDGGKVDVALEGNTLVNVSKTKDDYITHEREEDTTGNHISLADEGYIRPVLNGKTMVNVCDQKDPIAITKAYTVENSGNHVTLQDNIDGSCRPVIEGKTLVNLVAKLIPPSNPSTGKFESITKEDKGSYVQYTLNNALVDSTTDSVPITDWEGKLQYGLKGNTTYTILVVDCPMTSNMRNYNFRDYSNGINYTFSNGSNKIVFTTQKDFIDNTFVFYSYSQNSYSIGDSLVVNFPKHIILLEGDYTDKPIPDYFEGLQSSFEDNLITQEMVNSREEEESNLGKYRVEYKVTGKNKLNLPSAVTQWDGGEIAVTDSDIVTFTPNSASNQSMTYQTVFTDANFKKGTQLTLSATKVSGASYASGTYAVGLSFKDVNGNEISDIPNTICPDFTINSPVGTTKTTTMTLTQDVAQIGLYAIAWGVQGASGDTVFKLQLEYGDTATSYEPYKEYTKTLYLNSPLLEGDTIEERNGKATHIHRYKQVVLDGNDESWVTQPLADSDTTLGFRNQANINSKEQANALSDRFVNMYSWDKVEHMHFNRNALNITISKSKLQTQDVAGFRQWLQANPTTVVYELDIPQYETISEDSIVCDSYVLGHLDLTSAVPVEKVEFKNTILENKYLYTNTEYTIQFEADKEGVAIISLGGMTLAETSIVKGINKIAITTPEILTDNNLVLEGIGFNISNIVVTPAIAQDFGYFNGLSSTFEDRLVPENILGEKVTNTINKIEYSLTKNIKPNTTYTIYLESSQVVYCGFQKDSTWVKYIMPSQCINTITTDDNVDINKFSTHASGNIRVDKCFLLEGDYTNYDFSDYDPTKAGKYKVDYKVTGKNKFDGEMELGSINYNTGVVVSVNNIMKSKNYIEVKPSTLYTITSSHNKADVQYVFEYDYKKNFIKFTTVYEKITTTSKTKFILTKSQTNNVNGYTLPDNLNTNIQIEESDTATSYEPYKEYTKTLYLNSPLLEGDTIEDINGKATHVHRYKETMLDGSLFNNMDSDINGLHRYYSYNYRCLNYALGENKCYCDKLPVSTTPKIDGSITFGGAGYIEYATTKSMSEAQEWLQQNSVTIVYELAEPQYELIEQSNLAIPSYTNGHLDLTSAVPVSKVNFLHFEEELTYLYPSTSYTVQFVSDKAISVDITLGGTQLLAQNIVKGLNRITMTTPATLVDNKLIIDGVGAKISNVVVTDTDRKFGYFEGMKSVGECENNRINILSNNKNLADFIYKKGNGCKSIESIDGGFIATFNGSEHNNVQVHLSDNLIKLNSNFNLVLSYDIEVLEPTDFDITSADNYTGYASGCISYPLISNNHTAYLAKNIKSFGLHNSSINSNITKMKFYNIQISLNKSTDYIPHQSNIQTLTHEPLRRAENVKDKYTLIDGKWYIERRCGEIVLDGSQNWDDYLGNNLMQCHLPNSRTTYNIKCDNIIPKSYQELDNVNNYGIAVIVDAVRARIPNITTPSEIDEYFTNNPTRIVYLLATPQYEPIDYNPFEVYADITHITTNSTIPTNITIKNHGFNCLLKPSTTYTVSNNLGLSTVTTGADIGDSCLRFYNEDTSNVTTMKNVLILEGDWTNKSNLVPTNFSGIESCFEQELVTDESDVNYGKYKVVAKIIGKNKFKGYDDISEIKGGLLYLLSSSAISTPTRFKFRVYDRNMKEITELASRTYGVYYNTSRKYFITGSDSLKLANNKLDMPNNAKYLQPIIEDNPRYIDVQLEQGDTVTTYEPYKESNIVFYIDEPLRGTDTAKDRVFIQGDKVIVERNCGSVTLDGSEDWSNEPTYTNNNVYGCYILNNNDIFPEVKGYTCIVTNKFPINNGQDKKVFIIEGMACNRATLSLRILKSKLSTLDVAGFKQWLQQNPTTVVYQLAEPTYEEVEYSSNRLILDTFNNESFNNSTLFLDTNISPKLSFKPLYEELVYVKNSTKYYIQFNAVGSGEVVINLGGTELTTEIVEGYNCIPITTPSESTNLMTIIGQGITISEVVVSEVICGGYYKGLQSCFEEHMENGKYRVLLRGIALDGSKVNGIKLYIDEPLRGIGNAKDRLCIKDGKLMVERNCGSVVLDEKATWGALDTSITPNNPRRFTGYFKDINASFSGTYTSCPIITDRWETVNNDTDVPHTRFSYSSALGYGILWIYDPITRNAVELQQYLGQNPVTVVYQLAEPIYEEVTNEYGLPIVFEGYENGIVYIDSAVTPTTHIKYTSNNQLATTLSEAEEQNIATQEDINMNVITYMMDIDMILTDMEMSNDTSVMAVRRDSSNENMLDRMSKEDKKVYQDNTVVMLEKMITANVLEKEDIEGRINMYYNKNRISKEQYEYLKSLL